jgi:hydrogenase nickel incorporation protein HypA/HybF
MHEVALAQSMLDLIEGQAAQSGFTRVHVVRLSVGALSTVEPEALVFGFESVCRGTVAEGAKLVIERTPGKAYCTTCMAEISISSRGQPCPGCQGFQWLVTSGEELQLRDLEVD